MQYGAQTTNQQTATPAASSQPSEPPPPDVHTNPDAYWKYYYGDRIPDVTDPNYPAWYAYHYEKSQQKAGNYPYTYFQCSGTILVVLLVWALGFVMLSA